MSVRSCVTATLVIFLLLGGNDSATAQSPDFILEGSFWKDQGLTNVMPAWIENAKTEEGLFFAELDQEWAPKDSITQYPGMLARHIFSLSAAYLMDGDESHLQNASRALDFLVEHGWDEKHGGWYNAVTRSGEVVDPKKSLFMQIYATTGLALYAIVTKDATAQSYLRKSRQFMDEHAWDEQHGGYYDSLNRDGSVRSANKDFSPQLAPLSGYLLYLYPATRNPAYLEKAEQIMDLTLTHMQDDRGYILERFDRDWTFMPEDSKNSHINVGHNLEVAWLLLRLYSLTDKESYREEGLKLTDLMLEKAFHAETGAWRGDLDRENPEEYPPTTTWWAHAYGNMLQLYAYRVSGDDRYLDAYRKGAQFWNENFIDEELGGSPTRAHLDGYVTDGAKGKRSKTSYHSMEHSLLNYMYLSLWVNDTPITLHYQIENPGGGRLYPLLIEDLNPEIEGVSINGTSRRSENTSGEGLRLPDDGPVDLMIQLRSADSQE